MSEERLREYIDNQENRAYNSLSSDDALFQNGKLKGMRDLLDFIQLAPNANAKVLEMVDLSIVDTMDSMDLCVRRGTVDSVIKHDILQIHLEHLTKIKNELKGGEA